MKAFDPLKLAQESFAYSQQLRRGLDNLHDNPKVKVGSSRRQEVYREDKVVLYRYHSSQRKAKTPTLLVYALVNRPYMLDLQPNRSIIAGLLAAGQDVYLIDWGYPDHGDQSLDLEDYIEGYIARCSAYICQQHDIQAINLLGICQGGSLSLCYSALHPERVKNLVVMVTPVDFHTKDNLLSHWMRHVDIDLMVDTLGNIPGDLLNAGFLALKPFSLSSKKYLDLLSLAGDKENLKNFLRMEKWIFDSPDQAGEAFRQFAKDFFQHNKLIAGTLEIGQQTVLLSQLRMPILNVYSEQDHLVPPDASRALRDHVGSEDYQELAFAGGHIGIYVSGRAQRQIPPAIGTWLLDRDG